MDVARKEMLAFSFTHKLTHVPSALSMIDYVDTLFTEEYIVPRRDSIVLGKPFGSQTYYTVWKRCNYIENIDNLSVGVKHDEIDFVDYGEETMGNALGVATGIAIAHPERKVWVNITDATLQMGSTLEALQYIGHKKIKNIVVTVDYNNMQVTGATDSVLAVEPVINMCKNYKWDVREVDGHDISDIKNKWSYTSQHPTIFFYITRKGYGVSYMESDPVHWHYKPMSLVDYKHIVDA